MRQFRLGCLLLVACCISATALRAADVPPVTSPVSPHDSLKLFQLDDELEIQLVAGEPQIVDPVDARFDEQHRLWVVEMRDYPSGPAAGETPLSRISVLTDMDHNGLYESSQVFAEGLLFPTGLQPWKGGVIVTLSGQIVYLKDTDGDGRADVHEVWYRGFSEGNPQLRANHPKLGLDGWVYVACGLQGGKIVDPRRPEQPPINISGMDFRFDPRSGDCEAITGNGQFGLTFDDFGRRFVCDNRHPVRQIMLEAKYLSRNPYFAAPAVVHEVAKHGEESRVFPLTKAWTTSNLHAGQFTAACAVELYRGGALPASYTNSVFVCEPTGSLVHREVLQPSGPTFTSKPVSEEREFLASRDAWFRPVNLTCGPDGALYVVDMYRAVIEHPQFMPSELQKQPNLRSGDDRGRIYRIAAKGVERRVVRQLTETDEMGRAFCNPSSWQRDTATRLLCERENPEVPYYAQGAGRYQAQWLLASQNRLNAERLLRVVERKDESVTGAPEVAMQLAEPMLAADAALQKAVLAKLKSDEARAVFQAILSLGSLTDGTVGEALGKAAARHCQNVWMTRATLTARPELHLSILRAAFVELKDQPTSGEGAAAGELLRSLAEMLAASGNDDAIRQCLSLHNDAWTDPRKLSAKDMVLVGLDDGLRRRRDSLGKYVGERFDLLQPVLAGYDNSIEHAAGLIRQSPATCEAIAFDLLRIPDTALACQALLDALGKAPPAEVKKRVIEALRFSDDERVGPALVNAFAPQTPAFRREILDVLLARPAHSRLLLDAIESGKIPPTELDPARSTRLLQHSDQEIRGRAAKLLASTSQDRTQALADYQSVLSLTGDSVRGREVFRSRCSTCHQIGGIGVNVAPDISDSREKKPEQILTDILDPNRAIDNNYVGYSVLLADGQVLSGIITAEAPTSLTIKQAEGKTATILRSEIEELRSTGKSLMPEGLEKDVTKEQMADLISFIKNWRYLRD